MPRGIQTSLKMYPQDRIKFRLLATVLGKSQVALFSEMVDDMWQKNKDNPVLVSNRNINQRVSLDIKKVFNQLLRQAKEEK